MEKDKEELANLEAEEEAASAVDAEIDGVEAKIEQLTQGTGEDSGSQRVRRQAATTCVEVGTLVDEMTKERETAKKLVLIIVIIIILSSSSYCHHHHHQVLIRRITTSTILSCTSEDDKQFLVVAKTTLKEKIKMVKEANSENLNVIRQTIVQVKVKIVTKEKKIENILSKLEAIENQGTTTVGTQQGTKTQSPVPMTQDPTSVSTTTTQIQ